MEIGLRFDVDVENYPDKEKIEDIIRTVIEEVATVYGLAENEEISVLLCDNAYIHKINKEYRQMDRPTDVISFALNEVLDEEEEKGIPSNTLIGDLIISLDKAKEQGEEYGHGMEREIAYLTVHGCLHILGYDHMTEEDKKEMRTEEEYILQKLNFIREGQSYNE